MKPSGIDWIGDIPAGWEVKKLKYCLVLNEGGIWGDEPDMNEINVKILRSTEQDVEGNWIIEAPAMRSISLADYARNKLLKNDLMITKSSGSFLHIGK